MNSSIESSCDLNAGFYEAVEYETNEVSELCLENYYLSASTASSSDNQLNSLGKTRQSMAPKRILSKRLANAFYKSLKANETKKCNRLDHSRNRSVWHLKYLTNKLPATRSTLIANSLPWSAIYSANISNQL